MMLARLVRLGPVRIAVAAAVPLVAALAALTTTDATGYRATTRVAVPAPGPEGDPLVFAENFRALLRTHPVVKAVSSSLEISHRDVWRRLSSRQIGRGSVVEVTYQGEGPVSLAEEATRRAVVEGVRAAFAAELADADASVSARAQSRVDAVAAAARAAIVSRPWDRRGPAAAVAASVGLVLAVAGLAVVDRLG